jgi:hypothetical protein
MYKAGLVADEPLWEIEPDESNFKCKKLVISVVIFVLYIDLLWYSLFFFIPNGRFYLI